MYPSLILELYKNPSNYGQLKNPTKTVVLENPLCGDQLQVDFTFNKSTLIDVAFRGESCAISRASASLLTDTIKGMSIKELKKIDAGVMRNLIGIDIAPARLKCLLLPLEALKRSLVSQ